MNFSLLRRTHGATLWAIQRRPAPTTTLRCLSSNSSELPPDQMPNSAKRTTKRQLNQRYNWDVQGKPFKLCVLGRPNVGKSTLFNKLVVKNNAIVSKIPGTTRDRREGKARLGELKFTVLDTGGLEDLDGPSTAFDAKGTGLLKSMMTQVEYAMDEADVGFFVVDAQAGIMSDDEYFAKWIRQRQNQSGRTLPIRLVANKAENMGDGFDWGDDPRWEQFLVDCYKLGFGDPIPISAEHNQGITDIYTAIEPFGLKTDEEVALEQEQAKLAPDERPIQLALVGRTNVGKSTILNQLIGKERVIAGPLAGLTRDAIKVEWEYEGKNILLVDTAGIRKKSKLYLDAKKAVNKDFSKNKPGKEEAMLLEGLSIEKSLQSMGMANIVVLVVDLIQNVDQHGKQSLHLSKHDLSIMGRIMEEGRAMILAINKCDLIIPADFTDHKASSRYIRKHIEEQITTVVPLARGSPIVPISALTGFGMDQVMPAVLQAYERWNTNIGTRTLNNFIQEAQLKNRAPYKPMNVRPIGLGKTAKPRMAPVKIKFMNQQRTRPPTFGLFLNRNKPAEALPSSYLGYLTNEMRETFGLHGIPIRFELKSSNNPYVRNVGKAKPQRRKKR